MVYSNYVDEPEHFLNAEDPPVEAAMFEFVPAVQRVAPQLAGLAEIIGRHARHRGGFTFDVEVEDRRIAPHVGAVVGDEYGNIADHGYVQVVGVLLYFKPLLYEQILQEFMELDPVGELDLRLV